MAAKPNSRLREEILEMANDQRRLGVMDESSHRKITLRQISTDSLPTDEPITGSEIRAMREKAQMSQGALARRLNMSTGYISKLERDEIKARGPALSLLNVVRRHGIEVLL